MLFFCNEKIQSKFFISPLWWIRFALGREKIGRVIRFYSNQSHRNSESSSVFEKWRNRRYTLCPSIWIFCPKYTFGTERCLGGTMCQNHCVLSAKVAWATISRRRDDSKCHQVRSLRTKVDGGTGRRIVPAPTGSLSRPSEPHSDKSVWGKNHEGRQKSYVGSRSGPKWV